MSRQERRNKKYHMLIASGFNNKYATRFRDFSMSLVIELCKIRKQAQNEIDTIEMKVLERIQDLLYRKGIEL